MTQTHLMILAIYLQLLLCVLAYQYLSHRVDGKCQVKQLFKLNFDFRHMMVMAITFFAAAFVFLRCFLSEGDSFMRAMMNAGVMIWLGVIGYIDAKERIIPNSMILIALAVWLVLMLLEIFLGGTPWTQLLAFSGIGGLVCGGVLFLIAIIVKSALGMGDVKMFFVLGLLYGLTDTYGILLFSVIIMGIVSVVLLIAKKVTTKTAIPMAPFVVFGFLLSILAGM